MNLEAIKEITRKISRPDRKIGREKDCVLGVLVLSHKDEPITTKTKVHVDNFLGRDLGVWDYVQECGASIKIHGTMEYISARNVINHIHGKMTEKGGVNRLLENDLSVVGLYMHEDADALAEVIKDFEADYSISQFFVFAYYFDIYGGTDEFIYSVHMPDALMDIMASGEIQDEYLGNR